MSDIVKIGDATLYHGDCLEILPTLDKVDAVVTDPPYGVDGGSGTIGKERSHKHDYLSFEDTPKNIAENIVPRFELSLDVANGRGVITPGPRCLTYYSAPDAFGCLWQPAAAALSLWGRAKSQPIFYYGRPPNIGKTIGDSSFQITETQSIKDIGHPCPKPLRTMIQLCNEASLYGQTILDPFMGSGTTGVACANLGRKFIGIEIERKYFDIACERIDAAHAQGRLFA